MGEMSPINRLNATRFHVNPVPKLKKQIPVEDLIW